MLLRPWPIVDVREPTRLVPDLARLSDADSTGAESLVVMMERALVAETPEQVGEALLQAVVQGYGFRRAIALSGTTRLRVLAADAGEAGDARLGASVVVDRAQELQTAQLVPALREKDEPFLSRLLAAGVPVLVVPMAAEGRALGALVVQVPAKLHGVRLHAVTTQLERASRDASLLLHGLNRRSQLQRLAATDDLTMIANRRSFGAALERELARSARSGEPVSLAILDIDHFKQVNDLHGHLAGDEALRNVAASLTVACREFDTPARYGGEEFAVILPDCSEELCVAVAERFRTAVSAAPAVRPLTASAGVATFPTHAGSSEQLLHAADEALLLAKQGGRNQTRMGVVQGTGQGRAYGVRTRRPAAPPTP
ncbi:MAG: hypothetical protein NVSMB55_27280 [Mycobacteriales bacterium]